MKIDYSVNDKEVSVVVDGMWDTDASQQVQPVFDTLFTYADKKITIDCTRLTYMCSAGLRQLLALRQNSIEKNGSLVLTGLCDTVREVFEITNFCNIFDIR